MNTSFTMFNNYHTAAKEFANGDMNVYGRLMYIINVYAIEGETVEDLTPVEKLFLTSIKASIDKSLKLADAGRKGGSKTSSNNETEEDYSECKECENVTETTEQSFSVEKYEAYKPLKKACKGACNEIEIDKENDIDIDNEKDKKRRGNSVDLFDFSLNTTQNRVLSWCLHKKIKLTEKNKNYLLLISEYLDHSKFECYEFLDYVYQVVSATYENVNLGIIFNAIHWENTVSLFQAEHNQNKKQEKVIPDSPKICTQCGAKLVPGGMINLVECVKCREKGNPIWWEFDTNKKKWVCSK